MRKESLVGQLPWGRTRTSEEPDRNLAVSHQNVTFICPKRHEFQVPFADDADLPATVGVPSTRYGVTAIRDPTFCEVRQAASYPLGRAARAPHLTTGQREGEPGGLPDEARTAQAQSRRGVPRRPAPPVSGRRDRCPRRSLGHGVRARCRRAFLASRERQRRHANGIDLWH